MGSNIKSNMEYRQYLIHNSNTIIEDNLAAANANCVNTFAPIYTTNTLYTPVFFNSINDQPLPHNSDLKKNYLDDYIKISKMFTPGIMQIN